MPKSASSVKRVKLESLNLRKKSKELMTIVQLTKTSSSPKGGMYRYNVIGVFEDGSKGSKIISSKFGEALENKKKSGNFSFTVVTNPYKQKKSRKSNKKVYF